MRQMMLNRYRGRGGIRGAFTLIELLLVLVIIAALAAVVIPNLAGRGEDAKIKTTKGSLSGGLKTALRGFESDNSRYPTTEEGLGALVDQPPGLTTWKRWLEPKDLQDVWGNAWNYKYPGTRNPDSYDVWSSGPDGRPGTDDDVWP